MASSDHPRDEGRGRGATKVAEIPTAGWKDILWRTYTEVTRDHVMLIAAGVTFYTLLALVPALGALVSLYGLVADPATLERHMALLEGLMPSGGLDIVREQLRRLVESGQTRLGLASLLGFALALWSANSGTKAMFEAMNVAYNEDEKRSYVRLTIVTLAFTLAAFAAILLLVGLIVLLPAILALIGIGSAAQWAARGGGLLLTFLLVMAGLGALYRFGPSRHEARWRWITPGALLAMIVIAITSGLFSWYVASFGSYDVSYGSLGAIFGFMTWLWIAAIIVVVGAELNSEIEHQTEHDTTTGWPRPMGARGAVVADSVGAAYGEAASGRARSAERRTSRHEPWPLGRLALLGVVFLLLRHRPRGRRRPSPAWPTRPGSPRGGREATTASTGSGPAR
jgi:membrane protein